MAAQTAGAGLSTVRLTERASRAAPRTVRFPARIVLAGLVDAGFAEWEAWAGISTVPIAGRVGYAGLAVGDFVLAPLPPEARL